MDIRDGNNSISGHNIVPVLIIGGGAAGLMAGIGAGRMLQGKAVPGEWIHYGSGRKEKERNGEPAPQVMILDAGKRPGKKIYATGNGRCNLANRVQDASCYYTDGSEDPYRFLEHFGSEGVLEFFRGEGILLHERNGYIYPQTDQAGTIVRALLRRLSDLQVSIHSGVHADEIFPDAEGIFHVRCSSAESGKRTEREEYLACSVILCSGGMVSREFGCDGSGYRLAEAAGHQVITPIPALCALRSSAENLRVLSGVRAQGKISLYADGTLLRQEAGELQLTDYGISGIPAFQVSRLAGRALAAGKEVSAVLDFVPGLSAEEYRTYIWRRMDALTASDTLTDLFLGVCHEKIGEYIIRRQGLVAEKKIRKLGTKDEIASLCVPLLEEARALRFPVVGTNGFGQAQVTAGGVALEEVNPETMESRLQPGLYLAGEVLDVDGICGGYNLTFAMATGYAAGRAAASAAEDVSGDRTGKR